MTSLVSDRLALLRLLRYAGGPLVAGLTVTLAAASLVPAAIAVSLAWLVGRIQLADTDGNLAVLVGPIALFGGALVLGNLTEAIREPLSYLTTARINGAHRRAVAEVVSSTSDLGVLESPRAQVLVREAKADPENWTQRAPSDGALAQLRLLTSLIGMAGACVVLAGYAWWPAPLLLAAAFGYRSLLHRNGREWYREAQRGLGESVLGEAWQPVVISPGEGKEARVFGFGDWAVDRMQHHVLALFRPVWALTSRQLARLLGQTLIVVIPLAVVFAMVARDAATGSTSLAVATAALTAGWALFTILATDDARELIGGLACVRALDQLRELLVTTDKPSALLPDASSFPPDPSAPLVRFDQVSFRYARSTRLILDRLDLEIRPGELLAVVGANGAGKSTLIKLLAGLYQPTSGRITADGADITELGSSWRQQLAVVFQDFVHYQLSAEDNVSLGRPGTSTDQHALNEAAAEAGLDRVIADLPHGWRTPLSRSRRTGVELSGGQWQQVALARALYAVRKGARLVVLDEPTAHLDVVTEAEVFAQLTSQLGDATAVLISHRLSTVRLADRIVLLEGGRVAETGTHDELIRLGGRYATMFSIQAERFRLGRDDPIEQDELL